MRLAVIRGGDSPERDVSLRTGAAIARGLQEMGHEVLEFDTDALADGSLRQAAPDLVFNALHGGKGENGAVQGTLDILGIPYTGSGVLASAMAMDKVSSKRIFDAAGLPTPAWASVSRSGRQAAARHCDRLGWPVVVKPSGLGSTIGISIVSDAFRLEEALEAAFELDGNVLLEKYIKGREMTIAVIDGRPPRPLPVVEIVPHKGFYDYESKYTRGASDYLVPARMPEELSARIAVTAVAAFEVMGCSDLARADFMVNGSEAWLLEINTLPGMTETSLVPKAAAAADIGFNDLLGMIIESALSRRHGRE